MKKLLILAIVAAIQITTLINTKKLQTEFFKKVTSAHIEAIPCVQKPTYQSCMYRLVSSEDKNTEAIATLTIIKKQKNKPVERVFNAFKKHLTKKNGEKIELLDEFKHIEVYKTKMLLYQYWLKHDKKLYFNKEKAENFLKRLKILSTRPLKLRKKAKKAYADLVVITQS